MPDDSDRFTRWEMGPAKTLEPILRMATGIPSVPSADGALSLPMTLAILPAFAKVKEKIDYGPSTFFPSYLRPWRL
jgi:hypothetical protein